VINVEILTIGNEILLGLVADTNSNYLCRVVRGMGGRVRHIAVVRDEIEAIADEIKMSVERGADLIFTCGGLGPTDDDLTLAALAKAANLRLEINETAKQLVENRYRRLALQGYVSSAEMNEARLKMARLPEGARPVENSMGAAPAVVLESGGARIISLPGVPAELRGIIEGPLQSLLTEVFGRGSYRERQITVECADESELAPALRKITAAHPEVYIKSRASHFGSDVRFRILVSASGASAEETEHMIESAAADLIRMLGDAGIKEQSSRGDFLGCVIHNVHK
jgi:molybdenum cofactor synthesis domain-containing protein